MTPSVFLGVGWDTSPLIIDLSVWKMHDMKVKYLKTHYALGHFAVSLSLTDIFFVGWRQYFCRIFKSTLKFKY